MNAQNIFRGEHYAWRNQRGKGVFHTDAVKVRVLGLVQTRHHGNEKRSTYVKIFVIDSEQTLEVPAREIIDYWDSYVDEREHVNKEKQLRDAKVTKDRLTREIREQMLRTAFHAKGIHPSLTLEGIGHYSVTFKMNKEDALEWLGVTEQAVSTAVSIRMEELALPDPDRVDALVPYDL